MRIAVKPTEQEIIEGPQAVAFLIANGNARQCCVLQTELPTKALAQNISSQIGLRSRRWHATRSRRESLKTARSSSSRSERFIMNASFGLQEQLC